MLSHVAASSWPSGDMGHVHPMVMGLPQHGMILGHNPQVSWETVLVTEITHFTHLLPIKRSLQTNQHTVLPS